MPTPPQPQPPTHPPKQPTQPTRNLTFTKEISKAFLREATEGLDTDFWGSVLQL